MVKMNAIDVQVLQVRTFMSPVPGLRVSTTYFINRWVLIGRHTFLTDWLAENAHYVLCKHANTSPAAIRSGPTSFRRTSTLLAISYAYSTDAYTPSL